MGRQKDWMGVKQSEASTNSVMSTPKNPKENQKPKQVEFKKDLKDSKTDDWVIDTEFGPVIIPQE